TGRFIPTRVGRGCPAWRRSARATVHPHSRGERAFQLPTRARRVGSSPLAWGEGILRLPAPPLHRFIPTRVGRGTRRRRTRATTPVHPHSRGERSLPSTILRYV